MEKKLNHLGGVCKKAQRKEREQLFEEYVLPKLNAKFRVKIYPKFIKFEFNGKNYDYYPMGERLLEYPPNKWFTMDFDQFIQKFVL